MLTTQEIITTEQTSDTGPIVAVKPRKLFGLLPLPLKERAEQAEAPAQESRPARAEAKRARRQEKKEARERRQANRAPALAPASTLAPSPAFVPTMTFAPAPGAHIGRLEAFKKSIVSWSWARKLVFWIILSAGMVSELAFLLASLWVSVNANVHPFIIGTLGISEGMTKNITYLATTAYVALPECIVGLAVITTIGHIRTVTYNPRAFWPYVWSFLYGIPALFFLILSMITLSNAVANVNFTMPQPWVSIRALAAFSYAFTSLLYVWLGEDQEKDRLAQKDAKIAELTAENARKLGELERITGAKIAELTAENSRLNAVIEQVNSNLSRQEKANSDLITALNKSSEDALAAYSEECKQWLKSGIKTVLPDEIPGYTGHSKRKITEAIKAGKFKVAPNNKNLILVSSLVKWLTENPPAPANDERYHLARCYAFSPGNNAR